MADGNVFDIATFRQLDPLFLAWISLHSWIRKHMLSEICYEVTNPFPNFNGYTVEFWARIGDQCGDLS